MKTPLTLITVPLALSFLSGMFDWQVDDGMFIVFGFSMIAGAIWAWVIELKK
jgi:hypothetical protein